MLINGDKDMNRQFQKIKVFIIFASILCSSLLIMSPVADSVPLDTYYACDPILVMEYDKTLLEDPIIPLEEARKIPVTIKMGIKGPGADIMIANTRAEFIVHLKIAEAPEGCHASISPPIISVPLSKEMATGFLYKYANVSIAIDQNVPALSKKSVIVRLESVRLGTLVTKGNFTQELPFTVGYCPILSVSTPGGNIKDIHPDETASFTIEIENRGNGNTEAISKVTDMPNGWTAEIITSTLLGSTILGGNTKKTLSLTIKPPYGFGYHEDRAVIQVSITPTYYNDPEFEGEPHCLTFIVQSRGFSTSGFDIVLLLLAFSILLFSICSKKNYLKDNNKRFKRRKL